jgi:hypothetical protein
MATTVVAKPSLTPGPNSAPPYKEIRKSITQAWGEAESAATATPDAFGQHFSDSLQVIWKGLSGKRAEGWQGWVLQVAPAAQATYTVTLDMDDYWDISPPLGFEYRAIRLIGLADVVLKGVDSSMAKQIIPGQRIGFGGTITELKGYDPDEINVDPAVRLAVVLTDVDLVPLGPSDSQAALADQYKSAIITLKNPVCGMLSSRCYTYDLIIYGSGKVEYIEEDWETGRVVRTETASVSEDKVRDLIAQFDKISYFGLKDDYSTYSVSDAGALTTSITVGTKRKSIFHYLGDMSAPAELQQLERSIDAIYTPPGSIPTVTP